MGPSPRKLTRAHNLHGDSCMRQRMRGRAWLAGLLILVGLAGTAWAFPPPGLGGPFGFPGGENCPLRKFIMGQMGRALVLRSELDLSS